MKLIVAAGLSFLPIASMTAQARDSVRLDPVVITVSRLPEPAASASASVTVLRGDDLRARGIASVADALREVPGLAVVATGPAGASTSLFARGGNSNFVKVLIDGVAVNEAGGAFDFAHLRVTNVERIEVVRGPVSVLYGSDAVAGVVQIFTGRGDSASMSLDARAGNRETLDVRAEVLSGGVAHWSAGVSHFGTGGIYEFNNAYRNDDASASLSSAPGSTFDLRLTARYQDASYHFPTTGSGVATDSNAFTTEKRLVTGAEIGRNVSPWLTVQGSAGWNRLDRLSGNSPDSPADTSGFYSRSDSRSNRRTTDLRFTSTFSRATVTGGVERGWQREESDGTSRFGAFPPDTTRFDERRTNTGVFAQLVLLPVSTVRTTLGARRDDNARFGTFDTWRAAVAWSLSSRLTARASAGTAFREPAFAETFNTAFSNGNPELQPERSNSRELGLVAQPARGTKLGMAFFDQRFENLIQYVGTFGSPDPSYENVAAATARGLELEASAALRAAYAMVSVTSLHTRVREAGTGAGGTFVRGEQLLRRPPRSGSATIGYRGRHSISLTALHTGRRTDRDFDAFPARAVTLDPYTRFDAAASFALWRARLTVRAENLANVAYQEIFGFRTRGRTILAGARIER